jgi:aminomethyltransferase
MTSLQRTSLFETHRTLGGKIVPFAGWEMPVQYAGVKTESLAVRNACGLFDVSHMGQLDARGEGVTEALNKIVSADWSKVKVGRAAYALLLNLSGGVHDDIMGYRLAEDHWLIVVNASRAGSDEEWLRHLLPPHISLSNRYENQAMIAVQGPQAEALLQPFCALDLSQTAIRDAVETQVLGQKAVIVRGGYTGCDGFEWMGDAGQAPILWQALLDKGATPCGLGARDVLRLEAGLPLYGHELGEARTPDESGVSFAVKADKGDFVGRETLLARRADDAPKSTIRGLTMLGRAIPREGYSVQLNGAEIGAVTSGTLSPALDVGLAMAVLPQNLPMESVVDVSIRGALHPARIVPLPFVPRTTKARAQSSS